MLVRKFYNLRGALKRNVEENTPIGQFKTGKQLPKLSHPCCQHLGLSNHSTTGRGGDWGREGNDTESQAKMQSMDHPGEKKTM